MKCELDVCVAYIQITLFVCRRGRSAHTVRQQGLGSHRNSVERRRLDKTSSDQIHYPASVRMIVNFRVPQKAENIFLFKQVSTFQSRPCIVKVGSSYLRSLTVFTSGRSWGFVFLSVIFKTILNTLVFI